MKRRSLLQSLALTPVVAFAETPQQGVVEETPKVDASIPDLAGEPVVRFFTAKQFSALNKLADALMPALNGTPGALDARVPEFLDFLIGQSPADRQKLYRDGLDKVAAGVDFDAPLRRPWTWDAPKDAYANFLRTAKEDVLNATVNSYEWTTVVSKRNRNAGGVGTYWSRIE